METENNINVSCERNDRTDLKQFQRTKQGLELPIPYCESLCR